MTPLAGLKQVAHGGEGQAVVLRDERTATVHSELQTSTTLNHVPFVQPCTSIVLDTHASMDTEPVGMISCDATILNADTASITLLALAAVEIEAAATRLRPDPALPKALKRLLEGEWSYDADDGLAVRFDPRSKGRNGRPPKPYTTTADNCTCPGAAIRGSCYHPIAWQIVNEALTPTTALQCTLDATMFVRLCQLALRGHSEHVIIKVDSERCCLTLAVPDLLQSTIYVEMATFVRLTIEQQVCTTDLERVINALQCVMLPEDDQLILDVNVGTIMIVAGSVDEPLLVDGLDALPLDHPHAPSA